MVTQHQAYNPELIIFRPLAETDLTLLHRWLNTPHVSEWWEVDGKRNPDYAVVFGKFMQRIHRPEPVSCFLVLYSNRPAAFIESCKMDNFPTQKAALGIPANTSGIDTFIGETDFLHKGFGPVYIRKFLKELIFRAPAINTCIVDPDPANKIAVKAYEKAGFNFSHRVWNDRDKVTAHIMTINREAVCPQAAML
jgi:RimJ/RimL family protein N-acetyltransferase